MVSAAEARTFGERRTSGKRGFAAPEQPVRAGGGNRTRDSCLEGKGYANGFSISTPAII